MKTCKVSWGCHLNVRSHTNLLRQSNSKFQLPQKAVKVFFKNHVRKVLTDISYLRFFGLCGKDSLKNILVNSNEDWEINCT